MGPRRACPLAGAMTLSSRTQQTLPTPPLQLCIHAQNGRKCQYVGNCSFAHSPEERDMWTFMKENKSEWAGWGRTDPDSPTWQAPGHPLNLTLLPGPCPGPCPLWVSSGPGSPAAGVPQGSWDRVEGGSVLTRPSIPSCPPVLDMQQTYDRWLKKHNPGKPGEGTPVGSREGEKQIQMPTDYADIMVTPTRRLVPA